MEEQIQEAEQPQPTEALARAQVKALRPETVELTTLAKELVITDEASYSKAGEYLVALKGMRKKADASFDKIIQGAHALWKIALGSKAEVDDPLAEAEKLLKSGMSTFRQKQQEEQRRLEAERQRKLRDEEEAERLRRAVEASEGGLEELGDAILEQPVALPSYVQAPAPAPVKTAGVSEVEVWRFEIIDPSKIDRKFLVPDESAIRKVVQAMKEDAAAIVGGIRIIRDVQIRGRAAK